jgi:carbon storage regulator
MLVLTRKVGETIRIGDDVTVQVLSVRGGQVRLGLAAPSDVRIFREEVFSAVANARAIDGGNFADGRQASAMRKRGKTA